LPTPCQPGAVGSTDFAARDARALQVLGRTCVLGMIERAIERKLLTHLKKGVSPGCKPGKFI
jgi:hypothetical protein